MVVIGGTSSGTIDHVHTATGDGGSLNLITTLVSSNAFLAAVLVNS